MTNFNLLTGRENKELIELNGFFIHQEAIESFKKLKEDAKNEIGADIQIVSSFRDFDRQLHGWNLKANGQRTLYDDNDQELDYTQLSADQILNAILRWSAVPGASRHHWGTDIDIFDGNTMQRKNVQLLQSECLPDGPCGKLHLWLDDKISNNMSHGFFRPYETERGGVGVEKWHISYAPTSTKLSSEYTLEIFKKNIEKAELSLKSELFQNVEMIYKKYVNNTDPCPF